MIAGVRAATATVRNGKPLPRRYYTWRAPRVPWTLTAIAAAEAQHGPPRPTCLCGQVFPLARHAGYVTCPACGHRTWDGP